MRIRIVATVTAAALVSLLLGAQSSIVRADEPAPTGPPTISLTPTPSPEPGPAATEETSPSGPANATSTVPSSATPVITPSTSTLEPTPPAPNTTSTSAAPTSTKAPPLSPTPSVTPTPTASATSPSPSPTTPPPSPTGPQLGPTADWTLKKPVGPATLGGFAVGESIVPGQALQLKISGTGSRLTIATFRMGHYGGLGASLRYQATHVRLTPQPACSTVDRTVDCSAWGVTHSIPTAGWEPGLYLTRLTDDSGNQSYIATTLRSTSHAGTVTIMSATATHAAYNSMGGYSLYVGPNGSDRAYTVSLNRPGHGFGAEKVYRYELGLIQHLESLGIPLSYTTNAALHKGAAQFRGARALVALGHDEYWSVQMRANAQTLRDQGTNLVFLGANSIFYRIRWSDDFSRVTSYKVAALDPIQGPETTTLFRSYPYANPEARLIGSQYDCDGPNPQTDLVVVNPGFWAFAGTGASAGSRYASLVGHEVDKAGPDSPSTVHIAAHSSFQCSSRTGLSDITYYVAPSGAGVLNLGTMGFAYALHPSSAYPDRSIAFAKQVIRTIVTEAFKGPLGLRHTEAPNYSVVYPVKPFDVYTTPGTHNYNGRQWRTSCSAYSTQIDRCWTDIWATQVTYEGGKFVAKNDWYFNNLTYVASPRRLWTTNALGGYGKRGPLTFTWTSNGRQWKTECDTAASGRGGCRSYIYGSSITSRLDASGNRVYYWTKGWTFNNIVRFTD